MKNEKDMYELIAKYFAGEALPEEAIAIDDWRLALPENSSEFDQFTKIYNPNQQWEIQAAWEKILSLIHKHDRPVKSIYRPLALIAASIILVLTIATLLFNRIAASNSIVYQTRATSDAMHLTDGSIVMMHPNSTLTVNKNFGSSGRSLTLKGSATFNVKHEAGNPFIVDIENLHIKDIGTIFTVTTRPGKDTIRVKVQEGEVMIYDDAGKTINLFAGQEVYYARTFKNGLIKDFTFASETKLKENRDLIPETDLNWLKKQTAIQTQQDTIPPRFPGGQGGWGEFLTGLNYPEEAKANKAAGVILIKFMVHEDGSLTDFSIVKDFKYGSGEEAIRLLKTSPKWIPGTANGKKIALWFTQKFSLAF